MIDFVPLLSPFYLLDISLSEFEKDMTGIEDQSLNLFLSQVAAVFTFVTFAYIILCQIIIKMFFKFKKTLVKEHYKSILSFKILRVILGWFIIPSTHIFLTFFNYFVKDKTKVKILALPAPYLITLVGNAILLTYLLQNKDAWFYLKTKVNSLKDEMSLSLNQKRSQLLRKRNNKINAMYFENVTVLSTRRPVHRVRDNVYVIDLEQEEHHI